jgi:hypothetical protein
MLPGDPLRVFNTFDRQSLSAQNPSGTPPEQHELPPPRDPTTIKAHESNPFTGE